MYLYFPRVKYVLLIYETPAPIYFLANVGDTIERIDQRAE